MENLCSFLVGNICEMEKRVQASLTYGWEIVNVRVYCLKFWPCCGYCIWTCHRTECGLLYAPCISGMSLILFSALWCIMLSLLLCSYHMNFWWYKGGPQGPVLRPARLVHVSTNMYVHVYTCMCIHNIYIWLWLSFIHYTVVRHILLSLTSLFVSILAKEAFVKKTCFIPLDDMLTNCTGISCK